jgi:hypothetical protein
MSLRRYWLLVAVRRNRQLVENTNALPFVFVRYRTQPPKEQMTLPLGWGVVV